MKRKISIGVLSIFLITFFIVLTHFFASSNEKKLSLVIEKIFTENFYDDSLSPTSSEEMALALSPVQDYYSKYFTTEGLQRFIALNYYDKYQIELDRIGIIKTQINAIHINDLQDGNYSFEVSLSSESIDTCYEVNLNGNATFEKDKINSIKFFDKAFLQEFSN